MSQNRFNLDWQEDFKNQFQSFDWKPRRDRNCTDICMVFVLGFILFGTVMLLRLSLPHSQLDSSVETVLFGNNVNSRIIKTVAWMLGLSILLNILFIYIAKVAPTVIVYFSILISIAIHILLIIGSFKIGYKAFGILLCILLFIMLSVLLCCFKQHVEHAINLVRVGSYFLSEIPSAIWISVLGLFLSLLVSWVTVQCLEGFVNMKVLKLLSENQMWSKVWMTILLLVFFAGMIYYTLVYVVTNTTAEWHYSTGQEQIIRGLWVALRYHLGSITFAALVMPIITILRSIAQSTHENEACQNPLASAIVCLLKCCIESLDYYTAIIGRPAFSMICLTSQSLVPSARNAGILIFDNPQLYFLIQFLCNFIFVAALFVCIGLPTLVSMYLLSQLKDNVSDSSVILIIILLTLLISLTFQVLFSQSIQSLLIYYLLDAKLAEQGRRNSHANQMDALIGQMYGGIFRSISNDLRGSEAHHAGHQLQNIEGARAAGYRPPQMESRLVMPANPYEQVLPYGIPVPYQAEPHPASSPFPNDDEKPSFMSKLSIGK